MIVDDQSTSRIILEEVVSGIDPSIVVQSFANPKEALAWATTNEPDLVLTDFRMPQMDGAELVRRIRSLPSCADVPVVVITVVEDPVIRYQVLEAGATDVLNKPVDPHECRARCQNLLTLRRQGQILRHRAQWLERQVADSSDLLYDREHEALQILARATEFREDPAGPARVGRCAHFIAQRLGLSAQECNELELAAMLHDVGKVAVPDAILLKPGALEAQEFEIVRGHCEAGWTLLRSQRSPTLKLAADVALCHHERWDGAGYPRGLAGEAIPLAARIAAVADVYDALTSARCYRRAIAMDAALVHMNQHKGTAFDPRCIEAFNAQLDQIAGWEQRQGLLRNVD
ncbi:MAG: response regulator [Gammaproteobacteria bacterium]|nr:response regulator [Gammaproteobacteria bacterium]